MALLRRQTAALEIFDDQGPVMWGSIAGNWSHFDAEGFYNNTVTGTPTPGASLSFTFSGSQAWLYGAIAKSNVVNGQIVSYPAAEYLIDDGKADSQAPYIDNTGAVVYFQTPKLADGTHEIDITVKTANATNPFIFDYFLVTPVAGTTGSGVETSRSMPSSTSTSTTSSLPIVTSNSVNVGAIVGGVVGGIAAIVLLAAAAWYFLRKRTSGGQAYYFDKPNPGDILAAEDAHVEPYDTTATTPAPSSGGFNVPGPQSAYSDNSSNQPLNPALALNSNTTRYSQSGHSESGMTHVTGTSAQPRTGKAAYIAQQQQNVQQPVQLEDSGIRFNENAGQEPGPSHLPAEVPPSYTPH